MVRKSYNSGSYVAYTYNAEGSLARLSYGDSTGELASYRFEYDSLGRLIRSAELDADGGTVQRTEHIYDGYNRLSRQSWTLGGKTYSESYVYDDPSDTNQNGDGASDTNKNGDGALTQMTTATGAVIDYQYDTLRRLTRSEVALNGLAIYTTAYAFRDLDASRTTTQVQYRNVRSANGEVLEGKKYTYDALGNITRISQSTKPFYTLVAYEYDAQNQLTKETYYDGEGTAAGNITRTISYTYDTAGNILSETKTVGSKTTTKTFSYTDSNWKDLLTAVNGLSITYDASGNPETYYTGSVDRRGNAEVYDMYWGNGRQLTDVETDDGQTRSQISYGYDADGIRSWKAVDGEIHTYLTQGGKVMRETVGSTVMDFAYDESGKPFALNYSTNGGSSFTTYYYVLNLQGDVVKLVTASGTEAASYAYDAWGNLLSATGSMAYTNPLRYRGYYYDAETRFYYLQSRYYDPVYHRFINADVYSSTDTSDAVSCNMYAYCSNNPANMYDSMGNWPKWLETAAKAVAVVAVAVTAVAVVATATVATGGAALAAASVAFGTACGGLVGGIANERNGESFMNGWIGGSANGLVQSGMTTMFGYAGTIAGGGLGSGIGTAITESLNNRNKPKTQRKTPKKILKDSLQAAAVGSATSTLTAGLNYAFDTAVQTQASGLMPGLTRPFGEMAKGFFGSMDDAMAYVLCEK